MTLKAKLFSTIAAFCLVAVLMIVGVFAASSVSVNMSGQISFSATDVKATINGVVANAYKQGTKEDAEKPATITFDGSEVDEETDTKTWENLNWDYKDSHKDITFTITIQNDSTQRAFDSSFAEGTMGNSNITISVQQRVYTTGSADGALVAYAADTEVAVGKTIEYVVTFHIDNIDTSVSNAAWSGASISLVNAAA